MKRDPRRLVPMLSLFALLLAVYVVLLIVASDTVKEVIIQPMYYLLWVIRLVINSFPQSFYLVCLLGIGILMGLIGLARFYAPEIEKQSREGYPASDTRYRSWLLYTRRLGFSRYARETFGRDLDNLLLRVLIHQDHLSLAEVETLAVDQSLPPEVSALIRDRALPAPAGKESPWRRLLRRLGWRNSPNIPNPSLERSLEQTLNFLEQRLEIEAQPKSLDQNMTSLLDRLQSHHSK